MQVGLIGGSLPSFVNKPMMMEKKPDTEKEPEMEKEPDEVKPQMYTQKQLADLFKMSPRTLRRYQKDWNLGERPGRLYTPNQVRIILKMLGKPFIVVISFFAGVEIAHHDGPGK